MALNVRGATANRTARAVRSIVKASHTASRRLGLGQITKIQFEGAFGALTLAPGEMDAGAVWSQGTIAPEMEQKLMGLAGLDAEMQRS